MREGLRHLLFKDRFNPHLNMVRHILNLPGKPEAFFNELSAFQRDWYAFNHGGADLAYAAPEDVPNMCGFAAGQRLLTKAGFVTMGR